MSSIIGRLSIPKHFRRFLCPTHLVICLGKLQMFLFIVDGNTYQRANNENDAAFAFASDFPRCVRTFITTSGSDLRVAPTPSLQPCAIFIRGAG